MVLKSCPGISGISVGSAKFENENFNNCFMSQSVQ